MHFLAMKDVKLKKTAYENLVKSMIWIYNGLNIEESNNKIMSLLRPSAALFETTVMDRKLLLDMLR